MSISQKIANHSFRHRVNQGIYDDYLDSMDVKSDRFADNRSDFTAEMCG